MLDVNQTIVPDGLTPPDDGWSEQDELHTLVNGEPLPTWDGPMAERVVGPHNRLAEAVDWFMEEGDATTGDDDLPRLPVATTDETDPGPLSISLESEPEPMPAPPPETVAAPALTGRRRVAVASLVATAVLGMAGVALVGAMGLTAVGAGAATVWLASGSDASVPELEKVATAPAVVDAEPTDDGGAAPVDEQAEPVVAPDGPTAPAAAPPQPAAAPREEAEPAVEPEAAPVAPSEPEARQSRPPIVRPVGSGDADEEARTVKLITQPPAARIVVDGVDHGRTPLKLDLSVGTHTVVLEQGDERSSLSVTVEAGTDPSRFCFTATEGAFAAAGCP